MNWSFGVILNSILNFAQPWLTPLPRPQYWFQKHLSWEWLPNPGSSPTDSVTINDQDSRWVGAWWLGFLVTGVVILMSSVPFFFLPKSMTKQGEEEEEEDEEVQHRGRGGPGHQESNMEHENFLPGEKAKGAEKEEEKEVNFSELAKGTLSVFSEERSPGRQGGGNQREQNRTHVV